MEGVHLPVQLTWEKKMPPEFHAEVQKTYSLLTSIAIFCGVGAAAAVILGTVSGWGAGGDPGAAGQAGGDGAGVFADRPERPVGPAAYGQ